MDFIKTDALQVVKGIDGITPAGIVGIASDLKVTPMTSRLLLKTA
jgi:hypothetical protein